MKSSLLAATLTCVMLVGATHGERTTPPSPAQPPQVNGIELIKSAVRDLVTALGDPSNDVRAKAAAALRPVLAADPMVAANWHDETFWAKRIEETQPDMLLDDALALLLPELSADEREKVCGGCDWSGGTGNALYQLDDYWRASFPLKDFDKKRLIERPKLERFVRQVWIKPDDNFSGLWVTWHVNGEKANEIQYRDGKRDGTSTAFYADGGKAFEQHYTEDICNGSDTGWSTSGKKAYAGQYKNGKQDGIWRHWHENGQLQSETIFQGRPARAKQLMVCEWSETIRKPLSKRQTRRIGCRLG